MPRWPTTSVAERFWVKCVKSNGCWEWTGAIDPDGYALFKNPAKGYMDKAARVAWSLENGEIPPKLSVLHKCDNRLCVRPDHLFLGTQIDNIRDMVNKGRQRGAPREKHWNWGGTFHGTKSNHTRTSESNKQNAGRNEVRT